MTPTALRACVALSLAGPLALHTGFKRGEPAPNSRVTTPPTRIALWFTARPQVPFSRIQLTGPTGQVALGAVVGDTGNSVRADVRGAMAPGEYRVEWQTAGPDGHTIRGEYSFAVGGQGVVAGTGAVDAGAAHAGHVMSADTTRAPSTQMDSSASTMTQRVVRWWEYFALLAALGVLSFVHLVLPPLAARGVHTSDASAQALRLGEIAAVIYVAAASFRLFAAVGAASGAAIGGASPSIGAVLSGSNWGQGWLLGVVGASLLFVGMLVSRRIRAAGTPLALAGAVGMALSPALSGHAASAPRFVLAVTLDTVHVTALGAWIGGLLIVVLVGVPAMARLTDGNADAAVSALVNSFHPIALVAAPLAVLAGVGNALQHVTAVSELSSPYGRVLLIKVALALLVAGLGGYNSMRTRRRLGTPEATRHLRRTATAELVLASLVLAATTILVGTMVPMPGAAP